MLAAAIGAPAAAQDYPNRPVKIIVPFGAGGPADIYARFIGQHLQEALKQSFVIENRPGAGSIIGTGEVAKSAPDGYTLLMMSNTHTTNETLRPNKPFQLMRDFVPVAPVNYSDLIMVVHPIVAGQGPEGVPRAAEVQARRPELRLLGAGHALSHGRRAVQSHERHRHRARAAQGERRGAQRRDRRPRADDDRRHHHHGAHRAGRPGAGAGHDRQDALQAAARRADHRRGRRARLRGYHLARPDGAGGNAQADRRQAQRRDQQGAGEARRARRPGRSRAPCRSS